MIRRGSIEDVKAIMAIDALVLKTNWSERLYCDSILQDGCFCTICEEDHVIVGFNLYRNIGGDFEILQIAMDPNYQGKGFGTQLMNAFVDQASLDKIENCYLEVRLTNERAIKFYNKFGFERIHVRKNYYGPEEDGLVMKREC